MVEFRTVCMLTSTSGLYWTKYFPFAIEAIMVFCLKGAACMEILMCMLFFAREALIFPLAFFILVTKKSFIRPSFKFVQQERLDCRIEKKLYTEIFVGA
jgi:hypothetical protein